MPKYVQLLDYTQEGIDRFDELPERLDAARALAEELGGELEEFYLTLGQHDAVAVVDVPEDQTAAVGAIKVAQTGTVRSETLRAFDEDEIDDIVRAVTE